MPPRRQPARPDVVPPSVTASPGPSDSPSSAQQPLPAIVSPARSAQAASAPATPRGAGPGLPPVSAFDSGPPTPSHPYGSHAQLYEPPAPLFGPPPQHFGSHTRPYGPPAHETGSPTRRYEPHAPPSLSAPHAYLGIGTADIANLVMGRLDVFGQQMDRFSRAMDGMHARVHDLEYSRLAA
ncbi:hypothetical protein OC842_007786, partial [Tilletia horrida]